jgi:NTE family protein
VPNPLIIGQLRDAGRAAADKFLTEHKDDLNHRGTADLVAMFG